MRSATLLIPLILAALPAAAEPVLGEAGGNWAGATGQGFAFRAVLSDQDGAARLQIWQGLPGEPLTGDPAFDATGLVWRDNIIAGGRQTLALHEGPAQTTLRIVTESADEMGEAVEELEIRFIDNQFTVIGYSLQLTGAPDGAEYLCTVDLLEDIAVFNGTARALEPRSAEADNLSDWTPQAALDRGYCPPPDAG